MSKTQVYLIFLGIVVIVAVIVAIINLYTRKKDFAEGKIMKRKHGYWEYRQIFYSSATPEQVQAYVLGVFLKSKRNFPAPDVLPGKNAAGDPILVFKRPNSWTAALEMKRAPAGQNRFEFYFASWKTADTIVNITEAGKPVDEIAMNNLLTIMEKLFLSLDPSTTVESHRMELKSRPVSITGK